LPYNSPIYSGQPGGKQLGHQFTEVVLMLLAEQRVSIAAPDRSLAVIHQQDYSWDPQGPTLLITKA